MNWLLIGEVVYLLFIIGMAIKVINNTQSSPKATAYILLIFLFPIVGIIIYLSFGLNYRKNEIYDKKLQLDDHQAERVHQIVQKHLAKTRGGLKSKYSNFYRFSSMLFSANKIFIRNNKVRVFLDEEN